MPSAQSDRPAHPDRLPDRGERRAVVGWTHRRLPNGIELTVQSAASTAGLENGRIVAAHLLLTDNQALLLARYLLVESGHGVADLHLPERRRRWWWRWLGR